MKVEKRYIDNLVDSLTYHTHHFPGTTCTVAIAVLPDGFVAGAGKSACIDPTLFNSDTGYDIAIENARADAVNRLWEMEGYRLMQAMKQNTL
ncbi:hypothetical protein ROL52_004351 [Salmonella enterica]|nr:hypothetical protein [Salmonella enterica]ECA7253539.1 hypothetical protein [Salmonella enterica subsp. enterica serovar Oranienburg]EDQ6994318.1 hypothetical protein [Salmonella enterica subsp. enterica serovar Saintpaul]EBD0682638.1 hypothetical protein [Salmonella enterica]EBH5162838.1 hypothetical protein [Salmonella enterica]